MSLFQTKIRFLEHNIDQGTIIPITRYIDFVDNFLDEIKDKMTLQRFLGSLQYIADFYKYLAKDTKILYLRLQKQPSPWSEKRRLLNGLNLKLKQSLAYL